MPKKSTASTADIFLNAASQRVSDKERERLKQEAADKKEALRQQKEEARELKALKKAFPEYYAMVEPLLKAMESLPASSGGDEFFVRADLHLGEHYKTKVPTKSIDVWVLYSQEQKTPYNSGESPNSHSLSINRKRTPKGDRDDVDLALNGNKVLKLELDTDENGKIKISSHAYEEYYSYVPPYRRAGYYSSSSRGHYESRSATTTAVTHDSISGFAAALGAWVQDTAPERLPEIAAALGAGDTKIATERMTVNKPIKLAAKPSR